jgi:condensin complex subunit 1
MDDLVEFDINDSLKHYSIDPSSIATPAAPQELVDCEHDPDSLTAALINSELNPVVDAVAENPDAITRSSYFDTLQFLLKCVPIVSPRSLSCDSVPDRVLFLRSRNSSQIPLATLSKILDLLVSAVSAQADIIHSDLEVEEQETLQHHKQILELYGFLLQWTISAVETRALEKTAAEPAKARGKGAKAKTGANKDGNWDSSAQLETALDKMSKVLKLKLARIFVTTSERDTFIGLFTKPVYYILENEARVKNTAIRMHCFRVLCISVKHHGHAFGRLARIAVGTTANLNLQAPKRPLTRIFHTMNIWRSLWPSFCKFLPSNTITPNLPRRS